MEARHAQATRRSGDLGISAVSETRKLAAILVSDIVGYSRLAGADEDRIPRQARDVAATERDDGAERARGAAAWAASGAVD
jgi:hypothetical protein